VRWDAGKTFSAFDDWFDGGTCWPASRELQKLTASPSNKHSPSDRCTIGVSGRIVDRESFRLINAPHACLLAAGADHINGSDHVSLFHQLHRRSVFIGLTRHAHKRRFVRLSNTVARQDDVRQRL
jgi:hypothetical protein